jgi:hypothetical protein
VPCPSRITYPFDDPLEHGKGTLTAASWGRVENSQCLRFRGALCGVRRGGAAGSRSVTDLTTRHGPGDGA